jgi:plastocyanin
VTIKPNSSDTSTEVASTDTTSSNIADGAASTGGVGSVKGVVLFEGDFQKIPAIVATKDPAVCAKNPIANERLVVSSGGGVANVFIYLEKKPKGADFEASTEPLVFDQKGCVFLPHSLAIRVGQTVNVLSDDAVAHNTHTFPLRNTGFNQVVQPNDRTGIPLVYTKPEKLPVQVKCDIHPWMEAYHLPLDHPFVAVTDADGKFEITGLPAGTHEFRIWQQEAGYLERKYKVEIKGGEPTEVKLSFGADKFTDFKGGKPKSVIISALD